MPGAARLVDHKTDGVLVTASANTHFNSRGAVRVSDLGNCVHGALPVVQGSSTVMINSLPAARMGDIATCSLITSGSPNVIIGG